MERNSTNETFEHFIQENAEDFRMYPSPKVWDNISKDLNRSKRRVYFGFFLFLTTASLLTFTLSDPKVSTPKKAIVPNHTEQPNTDFNRTSAKPQTTVSALYTEEKTSLPEQPGQPTTASNQQQELSSLHLFREYFKATLLEQNSLNKTGGSLNYPLVKNNIDFPAQTEPQQPEEPLAATKPIKMKLKASKFSLMFFIAPSVSYRKLTENKSYLRSMNVPYTYSALFDINNAVTHKPDIGLEFGATSKYALTKNIKVRAGLQFNINRYDIKAFNYIPEVATIALNNGFGVDSLSTVSRYRNFNGSKGDWLENFYFQVSAPVGVEVKLSGNEKMHFGIATTIQPTYVIGNRAYMITADYKNYARVPWLMRRWNVNTNLETFVSYNAGRVQWQVGPQIRYQLLSSFVNKYPVKENLFDFGLKVGISLNRPQ